MNIIKFSILLFFSRFQKLPKEIRDLCEKPGTIRFGYGMYAKLLAEQCLTIETGIYLCPNIIKITGQNPDNPEFINKLLEIPGLEDMIYVEKTHVLLFKSKPFLWREILPEINAILISEKKQKGVAE